MNHGLGDILSRARRVAMMPVWLGQLATGAKSFGDNPILGSRRLNELGLHAGRVQLAHALATSRRARLPPLRRAPPPPPLAPRRLAPHPHFSPPPPLAPPRPPT